MKGPFARLPATRQARRRHAIPPLPHPTGAMPVARPAGGFLPDWEARLDPDWLGHPDRTVAEALAVACEVRAGSVHRVTVLDGLCLWFVRRAGDWVVFRSPAHLDRSWRPGFVPCANPARMRVGVLRALSRHPVRVPSLLTWVSARAWDVGAAGERDHREDRLGIEALRLWWHHEARPEGMDPEAAWLLVGLQPHPLMPVWAVAAGLPRP